jgi:hypothetical protein
MPGRVPITNKSRVTAEYQSWG